MAISAEDTGPVQGSNGNGDCIIVTAADERYFDFAREMIESVLAHRRNNVAIGFLDLGLRHDQRSWLEERNVRVASPKTLLELGSSEPVRLEKMGYLARPFLREIFPDFSVYIWLDADTWLQDWSVIDNLADGARARGAAMVRQNESAYGFRFDLFLWTAKHFILGYGVLPGLWLLTRPHINNGVFAMTADAPHWREWRKRYQNAFNRTGVAAPHDQFGLNAAVYLGKIPTTFLPATHNWICDLAAPMWSEKDDKFCAPYAPFTPISLLHLAGPAKSTTFNINTIAGAVLRGAIRFKAKRELIRKT